MFKRLFKEQTSYFIFPFRYVFLLTPNNSDISFIVRNFLADTLLF
ncbi:hypothetical protein QW060_18095 [Myroides ceti]|uniref:Uncharacterized protein n=1 Tax=Paenimyroides ceti TaxID=395087 RepID=A0ABT8CXQ4_9FLAO|nr:hypothetical protein [Paenimyroides ceti]MDN3708989.1 hypothetical protein [Paenimyroides ceti]